MPNLPPFAPEELDAARQLARSRGRRIRAVRRLNSSAAALAVLAIAAVSLVSSSHDRREEIHAVGSTTSTTSSSSSSTTSSTALTVESIVPSTTIPRPTTTTAPPPSTARRSGTPTTTPPPTPTCVTVTGEGGQVRAGWEPYWATEPQPNDPVTLELCVDDVTPAVGQTVTATVSARDPDGAFHPDGCAVRVFWDDAVVDLCRDAIKPPPEAPAPTPAEQPGSLRRSFSHAYSAPGRHTVVGRAYSADGGGHHPYESAASARVPVEVH